MDFFCTNKECKMNNRKNHKGEPKWYRKHGFYATKNRGRIQRFRCTICGKTFSIQTFSVDYYAHKVVDYNEIEAINRSPGSLKQKLNSRITYCVFRNRMERLFRQYSACYSRGRDTLPEWYETKLCVLFGDGCAAERFAVQYVGGMEGRDATTLLHSRRVFLSLENIKGISLSIWLQEYKSESDYIPQFIAA